MTDPEVNPIGYLQEICMKNNIRFPLYEEINSSGPDHAKQFTFRCSFEEFHTQGMSAQKKVAKSQSAKAMITFLRERNYFDRFTAPRESDVSDGGVADGRIKPQNNTTSLGSKNPISAINEYCQKNQKAAPNFVETSAAGTFVCECNIDDKKTFGHGSNKKSAKTEAAFNMCIELNINVMVSGRDDSGSKNNPALALQELLDLDRSKSLEYTDLSQDENIFVVKCTFDSLSCEGKGTTKENAKIQAASQVWAKLTTQNGVDRGSSVSKISTRNSSVKVDDVVETYQVDSSEEEDDLKNFKQNSSPVVSDLNTKLEELGLEPKKDSTDKKLEDTKHKENQLQSQQQSHLKYEEFNIKNSQNYNQ